ncbi:MAG: hypothetical protein DRI93_03960 [Aquificota bacterium]|nr:MAG: hypothetical protein DRI93_03960 [Aquificota bacterium]
MGTLVVSEEILEIIRELGFADIREVLVEHLMTEILCRISDFQQEASHFEDKYGRPFEEVKSQYEKGQEDFEFYDDLMAWQFAIEGLEYWKKRLEELKSAI